MKQLFLLSGGADSITMTEKYFEKNKYSTDLEFIYIDHANIPVEKKLMELNAINKYFDRMEKVYGVRPSLNLIEISGRLYTRETIFGAHHNPMWLGAIITVLPSLPKKFTLNIGLTSEDHMARYYEILQKLLLNASKLYDSEKQDIKYKLIAPILDYSKHQIYDYLFSKKLISLFWTCEGLKNEKMIACGKCAKCIKHERLMKKIVSPEDFFKIECERHMSFKFNEFHKYIKNVFDLNDYFLYYPDESKLSTPKYQDISLKTSKCDKDRDIAMMI